MSHDMMTGQCALTMATISSCDSYFTLSLWVRELVEGGRNSDHASSVARDRLGQLRAHLLCIAVPPAPIYAPCIMKILEYLENLVDIDLFVTSEAFALLLLSTTQDVMSAAERGPVPTSTCKLIDASMAEQLKGAVICVSHRIFNRMLRHHGLRQGLAAINALRIPEHVGQFPTHLSLLMQNDAQLISFLLDRTEIALRMKNLVENSASQDEQTKAFASLVAQLDPLAAFILFQMQCRFDQVAWIDLLTGQETKALEYMLRITQLLAGTQWFCVCQQAFSNAKGLPLCGAPTAVVSEAAGKRHHMAVIWETTTSTSTISSDDWTVWQSKPHSNPPLLITDYYATPADIGKATMAFLSRLSIQLGQCSHLIFDPTILIQRINSFVASSQMYV